MSNISAKEGVEFFNPFMPSSQLLFRRIYSDIFLMSIQTIEIIRSGHHLIRLAGSYATFRGHVYMGTVIDYGKVNR